MGWNSQPTRTISFDNVRIPANHLLGREGEGFKIAMKGLDGGRINIATCSVGAAQGALQHAQRYLHERQQFGQPLASFQALQFKLADMATELVAARQMVRLGAAFLGVRLRRWVAINPLVVLLAIPLMRAACDACCGGDCATAILF